MLKKYFKLFLQRTLGFKTYLFAFSILTIKRLKYANEFLLFTGMIPEKGRVLDIGANIGAMTTHMAKKLTNGTLYAFEPIPENVNTLKRIIKHYKLTNVKVFEAALGDEAGELQMVMPVIDNVKMQGLSHVLEDGTDNNNAQNHGNVYSVPVYKLDDIEELHSGEKIVAVKIDVENFEYHILKGGEKLLTKHKPVIYCELWENEKRDLTINYLRHLGYQVSIYQNKQLINYTGQKASDFFFMPL